MFKNKQTLWLVALWVSYLQWTVLENCKKRNMKFTSNKNAAHVLPSKTNFTGALISKRLSNMNEILETKKKLIFKYLPETQFPNEVTELGHWETHSAQTSAPETQKVWN